MPASNLAEVLVLNTPGHRAVEQKANAAEFGIEHSAWRIRFWECSSNLAAGLEDALLGVRTDADAVGATVQE